ncbi:MAG: site-2 protease family protein, partial [Verrucomicrobia bacterium]|nr:site-2 protease family protein [Verrucomicrobiota bacterium]
VMLASMVATGITFGWLTNTGWVPGVLIAVTLAIHELGHMVAFRYYGIKVSMPIFLPFVGALINMRGQPRSAYAEAVCGIGGPVFGTAAALVVLVCYWLTGYPALALVALFTAGMNLFNLLPMSPMDGGHVTAAIWRGFWFIGLVALAVLAFTSGGVVAVLLLFMAVMELHRQTFSIPWWGWLLVVLGMSACALHGYYIRELHDQAIGKSSGTDTIVSLLALWPIYMCLKQMLYSWRIKRILLSVPLDAGASKAGLLALIEKRCRAHLGTALDAQETRAELDFIADALVKHRWSWFSLVFKQARVARIESGPAPQADAGDSQPDNKASVVITVEPEDGGAEASAEPTNANEAPAPAADNAPANQEPQGMPGNTFTVLVATAKVKPLEVQLINRLYYQTAWWQRLLMTVAYIGLAVLLCWIIGVSGPIAVPLLK